MNVAIVHSELLNIVARRHNLSPRTRRILRRIGLVLMAMAGYDPREAVGLWERMRAANSGKQQAEWLSTHPADTTRISDIKRWLPEAMTYYRPR